MLVLPAWFPILLLFAKDTLIFFQRKILRCFGQGCSLPAMEEVESDHDVGSTSSVFHSSGLCHSWDVHVIYARIETQLRDVSCNYWERDAFFNHNC